MLHLVTGAPGAGKSLAVEELLRRGSPYFVLDVDWLADAASALAGRSIYTEPSTWPAYRRVWASVLRAALRNGQRPVLFTPADPEEVEEYRPSRDCPVAWLLLDCDDAVRRQRLEARAGWTEETIVEALADAAALRRTVARRVDTG